MTDAAIQAAPPRKVGILLGLGIFLLPFVFVWFLLRKGHSTLSRVLGFGWLGLVLIAGFSGNHDNPSVTATDGGAEPAAAAPANPASVDRVGSRVVLGDITATITKVRNADRFANTYTSVEASEGGTLVAVTYSVTNTSARPVKSYMMPQLKLVDPAGVKYNADIGKTASFLAATNTDLKMVSDLNPGITTKDVQVFEVSKQQYDPAAWRVLIDGHPVNLQ